MSATWARLVDILSRLLNDRDRETVLGDLAETDPTPWEAIGAIASLLLHRGAGEWPSWTAAILLAFPSSLLLVGYSLTVSGAYNRAFVETIGLPAGPGVCLFLCNLVILTAWRWTGGLIVDPLSRRTAWMSAAFAFVPCVVCITWFDVERLSRLSLLLLVFPAIWNALRRQPIVQMRLRPAIVFAACITILTIPAWLDHGPWFPNWVISWPAWYLAGTAARRVNKYADD